MRPAEAEKLLGGYATGTLTEEERQRLFTAALDHQEVFDALMDEEVLRDLLADPAVKAQLLLALDPSTAPRAVPFWRRTGVLGAAASLLVAASAGLLYLRSPDKTPPSLREETVKAPLSTSDGTPTPAPAALGPLRKAAPVEKAKEEPAPAAHGEASAPPPPVPIRQPLAASAPAALALAPGVVTPSKTKEDLREVTTQDYLAKKAVAARSSASAVVEVVANHQEATAERKAVAQDRAAEGAPAGVAGGLIGSVLAPPWWQVATRHDGTIQVTVRARREALLFLLKRGPAGVSVLKFRPDESVSGDTIPWHCSLRLAPGEVLDLYRLNRPVPEPSLLPEIGPVDGQRVRITPSTKKDSPP